MKRRSSRWRLVRAVTALALVSAAGPLACGDDRHSISWDFTGDRSIRSVGWKNPRDIPGDTFTIDRISRIRVRLPGGLLIDERDAVDVTLGREQDQVGGFLVAFPREGPVAAYRRAKAMAQRYRLDGAEAFDDFLAKAQQRRAAGQEEYIREEDGRLWAETSREDPLVWLKVEPVEGTERLWYVLLNVNLRP